MQWVVSLRYFTHVLIIYKLSISPVFIDSSCWQPKLKAIGSNITNSNNERTIKLMSK